jgi:magnesium transporter
LGGVTASDMKRFYALQNGTAVETEAAHSSVVVFVAPDDREKEEITSGLGLDEHDLESALDPDEISRVEFRKDVISLIWKRPKNVTVDEQLRFDVASLGLFLHRDRLIVITDGPTVPLSGKFFQGLQSPVDVLLRLLLDTVHHYLAHLKVIKQITVELGNKLSASMESRYFLQMFALGESLIYYINAIDANGAALAKLRVNAERLGFTSGQVESLADLMLDSQQCSRQAQIYGSVLSGLMDARGTIISNNVNLLLKNLTLITVIFLPLNLIASIGGMSEFTMMTQGVDWKVAYAVLTIGMAICGWATYVALVRFFDRGQSRRR